MAVTEFSRPVTVTLTYTDTQVEGLMEDELQLFYWNEGKGEWQVCPRWTSRTIA